MKRNGVIGRVWGERERLRMELGLPERAETVLMDATFGYKVRNNEHHREAIQVSEVIAGRDLKRMTELGLLEAVGEKRGRYYVAGSSLKAIARRCADPTKAQNRKTATI
jgi:hypothetical protein